MIRAIVLFLLSSAASAQTLAPATAPSSTGIPWMWVIIGGAVLLIGGFIYLKHKNPTAAAKVSTDASQAWHTIAAELGRIRAAVESKATPAAPAAEPTPVSVAGKQGVAGTFSVQVTGDPKVDLPAILAAYQQ